MISELHHLCYDRKVGIKYIEGDKPAWQAGQRHFVVTVHYQKRRLTTDYWCSGEPKRADVVACLCSDARAGDLSFKDFCSDFGYDDDSRQAEQTWRACVEMGPKVRSLLGEDFDVFANAEH